ncbi:hypothetical protein CVT25_014514 [Psilocybe cyanescens]|uniref:F-box domain-containing protein n=1 Tax=Psilocybe cyanescens TaxID=93625 RepID=A0A409WRA5_PSICY|nr:hypothetical protein CVT25_014514 [Psilocybe cyanescens]
MSQPNFSQPSPIGRIKHMQEIPYDVWRCITDFLSVEEVKRLYAVNRSLLNISLDERYRIAFIGSLFDKVTEKNLNRLIEPKISSRVREFTFNPGHLCKLLYETRANVHLKETSENTVTELLDLFKSLDLSPRKVQIPSAQPITSISHMPAHLAYRNVLRILKQMICLTSLRIVLSRGEYRYFEQTPTSFFTIGWATFGSNLRSLDLRIPLEAMEEVLSLSNRVTLTNLQNLSLQIIRASLVTDASVILMEIILPFIIAHRYTLHSLILHISEQINLSPLLLRLEPIISLQTLKLKQPFVGHDQTDLTGLKHFFQVHCSHLRHFHLDMVSTFVHYPTPYPFFAQSCFGIALPKLRHLSIYFHKFPLQYSEGMIPYILQFKTTLVSLEISEHPWSLERLKILLKDFSANSPLRELKCSMSVLDPPVVEALATSLPSLDILDIDFERIGPEGYVDHPTNTTPLFAHEMCRLNITTWRLRDLRISSFQLAHVPRVKCKHALVGALPNVQKFCGLTREEYLLDRIIRAF